MTATLSTEEIAALVTPDRVHRRVYTDPAIFDLEMARIFGRCWIFLVHESQIAKAGDFFVTRLGREEVIVSRDQHGAIHAVVNRCTHRGAQVCTAHAGNTASFVCPYHAWQYRLDGALINLPHRASLPDSFDIKDPRFSLARVPRIASYRGFVFGCMAEATPSLEAFLGPMTAALDNIVDRSPSRHIQQAGGIFRQEYRGNWKLHHENANDIMHAGFVHESSVAAARGDKRDYSQPAYDLHQTHTQLLSNGFALKDWLATGLWGTEGGHTYMGGFYKSGVLSPERNDPTWLAYRARLVASHGEDKARAIIGLDRFNNLIYPNISVNAQYQQVRVVQPLAPDRTRIVAMCFRLDDAPDEMYQRAVRFLTNLNSPASMIFCDDMEIFERCQRGFASEERDWIDLSRGMGREKTVEAGTLEADGTSELAMRAQYAAWKRYMVAA